MNPYQPCVDISSVSNCTFTYLTVKPLHKDLKRIQKYVSLGTPLQRDFTLQVTNVRPPGYGSARNITLKQV